ncbi:hypothetical protein K6T82_02050 [Flavobacterium sp. 17A]|uniref:Uncharacterized protein n=1 Tax=Flavobacterium potami TaxID=2872310 RepID=A0A9X1KPW5_9FLAO|nr:hypothetical protein [Flavobacterium potami]MBZ4033531.1 hypothetical protein [Flavobacterium potami]
MKKIIFFFFFLSTLCHSQKNADKIFLKKEIQTCRIPINDTLSVYYLKYKLNNYDIKIFLKTASTITDSCFKSNISKDIIDKVGINHNPIIQINNYSIKDLNIPSFYNLIPEKIILFKNKNYSIIALELYSYSHSTVGNGYINLCFKIDSKGNIIDKKMIESKLPLEARKYRKIFNTR